jgi:hypothetical protein
VGQPATERDKPVETGLTRLKQTGNVVKVPGGQRRAQSPGIGPLGWGSGCGVWLFFENSTGCLISQCQDGLLFLGDKLFLLLGQIFRWFLLESLILAQDERWRRA